MYMLIQDTPRTRLYYYRVFTYFRIILLCLFAYKVYMDFFGKPTLMEQKAVANICNQVEVRDKFGT